MTINDCMMNWRGKIALLDAIEENKVMPLRSLRVYLYKDESGDPILLTKYASIFLYSGYTAQTIHSAVLGIQFFSRQMWNCGGFSKLCCNEWRLDDEMVTAQMAIKTLPTFLGLVKRRTRYSKSSNFMKKIEEILGHKVYPFTPNIVRETSI